MKAMRIPAKIRQEKLRLCPFCAVCHTEKDLELNHIDPNKPATIDNLIVLCSRHHGLWHDMSCRNRHADNVRRGIAEAKGRGVRNGRKPADYEKVMQLIAENSTQFNPFSEITEHEIMTMAGVKEVCYSKCKRKLLEAMALDVWPYSWKKPRQVRNRPMYDRQIKRLRGGLSYEP